LETDNQNAVFKPIGIGRQRGQFLTHYVEGRKRGTFLCSSGPKQVIIVALRLAEQGAFDRTALMDQGFRNAASDLVCLGLAEWTAKELIPSPNMLKCAGGAPKEPEIYRCIKSAALNSSFLTLLAEAMKNDPAAPLSKWAESVSKSLGRSWSLASAKRYIGAGRMWLRFFTKKDKQSTLFDNDNW